MHRELLYTCIDSVCFGDTALFGFRNVQLIVTTFWDPERSYFIGFTHTQSQRKKIAHSAKQKTKMLINCGKGVFFTSSVACGVKGYICP